MRKKLDEKTLLATINRLKLFTLSQLCLLVDARTPAQKDSLKDSLKQFVKRGYLLSRGDVYIPIFKKSRVMHGIIGYENPAQDFYIVCDRFEIKPGFAPKVLRKAEEVAAIPKAEVKKRKDYRSQAVFTIDGEDAKDLDDAVFLEKDGKNYRLYIHIADVSFYVREKDPIDKEASARGTSIYLVDQVVPMLPKVLSNGMCSLNPLEDRLTLTAEVLLDAKGKIKKYDFFPGIINSKRRFTYTEVQQILDTGKPAQKGDESLIPILQEMEKLAKILREKRFREGSLDFDIPEMKILCDKKSRPLSIAPYRIYFSNNLIEEFMLTANQAVALFLHKNKVGLYRVHEEPASDKLENFIALANRMGFAIKEFKDSTAINAFLQKTKEHPESYLLSTMLLRSMQQAYYHHENFGHYGLGFSHYTHFTSPIRRYPDLVVHRLIKKLKKYESDSKLVDTTAFLTEACKTSSEKERQAVDMERAIKRRKSIHFLKDHLGETFAGIVSGVTERGIYVALTYTGIEGMVLESLLEGFEYDDERKEFRRGKTVIRLGTLVRVRLISMNLHRELIDFQWIENLEHEG